MLEEVFFLFLIGRGAGGRHAVDLTRGQLAELLEQVPADRALALQLVVALAKDQQARSIRRARILQRP